jgi:hypothetical protein
MLEKAQRKVLPDAPTIHSGIDVLREFLYAGGRPEDFAKYAAKRKAG